MTMRHRVLLMVLQVFDNRDSTVVSRHERAACQAEQELNHGEGTEPIVYFSDKANG